MGVSRSYHPEERRALDPAKPEGAVSFVSPDSPPVLGGHEPLYFATLNGKLFPVDTFDMPRRRRANGLWEASYYGIRA